MRMIGFNNDIIVASHDNGEFTIIRDAFENGENYIGFYIRDGKRYRVLRKSLYGEHITNMIEINKEKLE